ncbi:MAG: inorganic phosphate transporter [Solirubrobacterales bacterium]|nr:inorganic phosphate transporter [Solirubrobacterales bacterium]
MATQLILLILLIVIALGFDFTNGFHDTANAVATSVATGALKPRQAVLLSAFFNIVGAFISISVATKIASGLISTLKTYVVKDHGIVHGVSALSGTSGLLIVFAALCGAILWNLITWYFTLPSSSSHALIGGIIGAALVAGITVKWSALWSSVVIPAVLSPVICLIVASVSTFLVYRLVQAIGPDRSKRGYKIGQLISASLVSLAHGTNDAQKTMGVITLGLIAYYTGVAHWGSLNGLLHVKYQAGWVVGSSLSVPIWVKILCAAAMGSGTAIGGWRIINTMGNRITEVEAPQGFAAETASAAVILSSSYYGYPLSTTHVVSGGVMGSGLGRQAAVHWNVAGQMATGWIFTIPMAGVVAAVAWAIADIFGKGSAVGGIVIAVILAVSAGGIYYLASRKPITAEDLDATETAGGGAPPSPPTAPAATATA